MRLLIGLGMSLIIAIGAVYSFVGRPVPVFAETRIKAEQFSTGGLALAGKRIVAVGELGHVLFSDDGGKNWAEAKVNPDRQSALTQVAFFSDKGGVAVGYDGWVIRTEDGGSTWTEALFEKDISEPMLGAWGLPNGTVFAFGSFGRFFMSQDGGRNWQRRDIGSGDKHLYAMTGADDGRLMLVGEQGLVMRSSDGGATWQAVPQFYKGSLFGVARLSADEYVCYGLRGTIYVTRDFGETWQLAEREGLPVAYYGSTVLADGRVVLVGQGGAILESRDRSASFKLLQTGGNDNYTSVISLQDGRLLIGGDNGIKALNIAAQGGTK